MSNLDLALFLLSNIASFLIGGFIYFREGGKIGYKAGSKDEQMVLGISIARAFPENPKEAMDKIATEYRRFEVEVEQKMRDKENAG